MYNENIKLSKYNIIREIGEKTIVYNTISGGILALNEEYAAALHDIIRNGYTEKKDLCKELLKGKMILPDNANELDQLLILNNALAFDNTNITLTIAPTLACNFKCPYCYEKGAKYTRMNENVQEKIVDFIKNRYSNVNSISIAWYGGEPLLALDIIESLTKKIKNVLKNECTYRAGIVTNGYLLDREVCKKLKSLDVKDIQVTLDGAKEDHDKRRILHDGTPTFEKILKNIKDSYDLIPIKIRMNIDKSNILNATEILDWLEKYELKNKVSIYLAPVDNINDVCNSCNCMNMYEFSKEEINFYKIALKRGFDCININQFKAGVCGAISLNSFVIGPDGKLYKCWNDIGHTERIIGEVGNDIIMNENFTKWLSYKPVHDEECAECKIFPVCFGGCPYTKITENDKKCVSTKYNIDETLKLIYDIKTGKL